MCLFGIFPDVQVRASSGCVCTILIFLPQCPIVCLLCPALAAMDPGVLSTYPKGLRITLPTLTRYGLE